MKDRKIIPPKIEKSTVNDAILRIIGNESLTSDQVWKKIGNKHINHIRTQLPNMCREGYLEKVRCESCNVGIKYRRKK